MSNNQDEHNRAGLITFMASMAFTLLFFIYISFVHPGVKFEEVREKAKASMELAKGPGAKVDVSGVKNPWVSSEDMVAHGQSVYVTNCAMCHGKSGGGDGVAGATLVPKPRDLIKGDWTKDGSTKGLYETIKNGIPGGSMAAFAHIPKVDRWALVHYIQSITKNKIESDAGELEKYAQSEN